MQESQSFKPQQCRLWVLRAPIAQVVRTSFGIMRDRPVVLVSITDEVGHTGWGEVWCNFPSCGAEHRAHLVHSEIAPLLLAHDIAHPAEFFADITKALHLLVNQTGEDGPVAQAIAGVDMALWDLYAQRLGLPLHRVLKGESDDTENEQSVPLYASGLNPHLPENLVEQKYNEGYRAFKLKVGFDDALDVRNAKTIRNKMGPDIPLMLDANQAWDLERAKKMIDALSEFNPLWMEEPLPVDAPRSDWVALSNWSPVPLAGGENLRGLDAYDDAIESGVFKYIQPDVAKWGGLTGTHQVAMKVRAAGLCYCPHWLGGGVGLMASSHLLRAVGGDGLLEVDANPNPLRDQLFNLQHLDEQASGIETVPSLWQPGPLPGLGVSPNKLVVENYCVKTLESS